jgi:hypothetical protein
MKETWLIQRLSKPVFEEKVRFMLGGGHGLTKEARQILRGAFQFEYMGSAEFEFGSVPDALERIIEAHKSFVTGQVTITLSKIEIDPWEKDHYRRPEGQTSGTIYIFCHKDHLDYAKRLVETLATRENSHSLKERSYLKYGFLEAVDRSSSDTCGWMEMNNGFFFFTDLKMFRDTLVLFGMDQAVGK